MKFTNLNPFGLKITAEAGDHLEDIQKSAFEEYLREHKVVVLRGFSKLDRNQFLSFCESIPQTKTLQWSFGPVMEMKEDPDPQNYLFSREHVPFHWDGAFHVVADYLMFSCVEAPVADAGGETLFTNTEALYAKAPSAQRKFWNEIEMRYATEKVAHYGGKIQSPLVQRHPHTGSLILRFAEAVQTKLNPVTLEVLGASERGAVELIHDLTERIYSSEYCYRHEWQEGDLLFADNHSLIHGRTAFQKNCPRHLRRIQLLKEKV